MIWADAVETNLDRLRRYAAFACGSAGIGDNVVSEALQEVLQRVSSAEPANRLALFRRLDEALRIQCQGHADTFADFGRWQFLKPLERRIVLLIALEGFSWREAADIVGVSQSEAKSLLGRARMKYADRFPARVGLIGADETLGNEVARTLTAYGHELLWSVPDGAPVVSYRRNQPNIIIVVDRDGDLLADPTALPAVWKAFADQGGIVIVATGATGATGAEKMRRISSQLWSMPVADLSNPPHFRSTLVRILLFSS